MANDDTTLSLQGAEIPRLGFGTWEITGSDATTGVADALELGYRHIDTARAYGNEAEVGRGMAQAAVDREDVFLTTKLWYEQLRADEVREQLEDSLRKLDTDYVDLLLIHWFNPDVPLDETLNAMAELRDEGKVRHLGVSNFPTKELERALEIQPVLANQVEFHAHLGQDALLRLCEQRDVMLTAYSPFARGDLLQDETLNEIAQAHGRSAAQVALRWLLDKPNTSVIPKANSRKNREANLEVFDFTLTEEDHRRIDALPKDRRVIDPPWSPRWDEASTPP